ncbi:MAG: hypothetical protein Q8L81_09045 [Bacteroidota bacterium]|nr:hypothetical protein [Bacteroidota bacterium]
MFKQIKLFYKNNIGKPYYRSLYLTYLCSILLFNLIFYPKSLKEDALSFFANVSEFTGLCIALHEIFIVNAGITEIKKNIHNANSLLVTTEILGKFEIVNWHISKREYKLARIHLQHIYNNYMQIKDSIETKGEQLIIINKTLVKINTIISDWILLPKSGIDEKTALRQIKAITGFNNIIIQLKNNLINQQL